MAMDAKIPTIATTIINSIRVNPFCPLNGLHIAAPPIGPLNQPATQASLLAGDSSTSVRGARLMPKIIWSKNSEISARC